MNRAAFERVAHSIAPGGRLIRNRRLHAGIASIVHRLDIELADGSRQSVTLRYSAPDGEHTHVTPQKVSYEFAVLGAIRAAGISVPESVLLDTEGELLGVTAVVFTHIPGRPRFDEHGAYVLKMAAALAGIHAVDPTRQNLGPLRTWGREELRSWIDAIGEVAEDAFAREMYAVLASAVDEVDLLPPSLVHGDFWAGNVIWSRGRVSGIIDWDGCYIGDRRRDVSEFRVDLVMRHGIPAADTFLAAYEDVTARPLPGLRFFDLWRATVAYVECDEWLRGLWELGMTHLKADDVRGRLKQFIQRAEASAT